MDWMVEAALHALGLSNAQMAQVQKAWPAIQRTIDASVKLRPVLEAQMPLVTQVIVDWGTVGPVASMLATVLSPKMGEAGGEVSHADAVKALSDMIAHLQARG